MIHYAVIDILSLRWLYRGTSLTQAAIALEPGTTYGSGTTAIAADVSAMDRAMDFRR